MEFYKVFHTRFVPPAFLGMLVPSSFCRLSSMDIPHITCRCLTPFICDRCISLYRGLAPTLMGSFPKAGIRFGLNSVIKEKLRDENGKLTVGKNFIAGLGAGVTEALVIVAPVETIKTKVIELNMSFGAGLKHIIKTEGLGGVYQGVGSS